MNPAVRRRFYDPEPLRSLIDWKSCLQPASLPFRIVRNVRVTHRRQFTGSVCTGVSMIVRAVGDDLSVLVRQQLRCEFFHAFRWNVECSWNMGLSEPFWSERLDKRNSLSVKFC